MSLTHTSLTHMISQSGITVVETPEFISRSKRRMPDTKRGEIVDFLASNPEAGEIMPGTGGARKIRFAADGRGKRGSYRVIYFYYNDTVPLFLFTVFAKNEKINLTGAEKIQLRKILKTLVSEYQQGVHRHVKGRK